jgi:hypothetical protein
MRRIVILVLLALLVSFISVVDGFTYGQSDLLMSSMTEFTLGELDCSRNILFESIDNDGAEIAFKDMDSGQNFLYNYSDGQMTYRPNEGGYFKKLNISFGDIDYLVFASVDSNQIYFSQRYNFCLSDSRYIGNGETFTLGSGECSESFVFESEDSELTINREGEALSADKYPRLIKEEGTSSYWDSTENNPQWGSSVYKYNIRDNEGNVHVVLYLSNHDLLFVREESSSWCFEECVESWSCGDWSDCLNGQQARTCTEYNNCGTEEDKPSEVQGCTVSEVQNVTNYTGPVQTVREKFYIQDEEAGVERGVGDETIINVGEESVSTSLDVVEVSSKIFIRVDGDDNEIKILPEEAISKAEKVENVRSVTLEEKDGEITYVISGTKEARLFFIFSALAEVKQKISIEDGEVVDTEAPWWRFLAFGV